MARYTCEVEAEQWQPGKLCDGVYGEIVKEPDKPAMSLYYVNTSTGKTYLNPGEWVVRDLTDHSFKVVSDRDFRARFQETESLLARD